jgi:hypothetical protein
MDCDHWIELDHISHLTEVLTTCRQKKIGIALSNPFLNCGVYCILPIFLSKPIALVKKSPSNR